MSKSIFVVLDNYDRPYTNDKGYVVFWTKAECLLFVEELGELGYFDYMEIPLPEVKNA